MGKTDRFMPFPRHSQVQSSKSYPGFELWSSIPLTMILILLWLATLVEGYPKLPFQYLLHQGVGEGVTPSPGLLHFTLETYLMLSVKQGGIKYHFLSLWYDLT